MIFYRGITVEANKVNDIIKYIKANGITGQEAPTYSVHDLKDSIATLLKNPNLNEEITRPSKMVQVKGGFSREYIESNNCICCSSDINTATYYANIHNRNKNNTEPLIIKFEMPISDVYIDGRDFLHSAFNKGNTDKIISILEDLYGPNITQYYKTAIMKEDVHYRTAIVDLVCQDGNIIDYHYNNDKYIRGRYGTIFKSAFMVKAPILPTNIIEILQEKYIQPNTVTYDIYKL